MRKSVRSHSGCLLAAGAEVGVVLRAAYLPVGSRWLHRRYYARGGDVRGLLGGRDFDRRLGFPPRPARPAWGDSPCRLYRGTAGSGGLRQRGTALPAEPRGRRERCATGGAKVRKRGTALPAELHPGRCGRAALGTGDPIPCGCLVTCWAHLPPRIGNGGIVRPSSRRDRSLRPACFPQTPGFVQDAWWSGRLLLDSSLPLDDKGIRENLLIANTHHKAVVARVEGRLGRGPDQQPLEGLSRRSCEVFGGAVDPRVPSRYQS